jgi:hypothetical protein
MKPLSSLRLAGIAALALTAVSADAITYVANRAVGTGSVDLSISTDGTLGALDVGNITDWSITVSEGGDSFTLNPGNSGQLINGGVFASATDLVFDFSGSNFWLIQTPGTGSGQPFWCVQGNGCFDFAGPGEGVLASFDDFTFTRSDYQGQVVIASAGAGGIPEPATWALMIAGFGLVGAAVRRRAAAIA